MGRDQMIDDLFEDESVIFKVESCDVRWFEGSERFLEGILERGSKERYEVSREMSI